MSKYDINKFFPNPLDVPDSCSSVINPELSEMLSSIADIYSSFTTSALGDTIQAAKIIADVIPKSFLSSLSPFLNYANKTRNGMSSVVEITANIIETLSKKGIPYPMEYTDTIPLSVSTPAVDADFGDYVTLDAAPIKELELSDNVAVSIGCHRFKMRTEYFIALIGILLPAIITIFCFIAEEMGDSKATAQRSEQIHLLQQQNQTLHQILDSVDSSSSSQASAIEDLKKSFQFWDSALPYSEESADSCQRMTGNKHEPSNTESEN